MDAHENAPEIHIVYLFFILISIITSPVPFLSLTVLLLPSGAALSASVVIFLYLFRMVFFGFLPKNF